MFIGIYYLYKTKNKTSNVADVKKAQKSIE